MTDQEREIVRKAAVALCNLIDCFRGIEYRTHAAFTERNGNRVAPGSCEGGRNPYTVAEFKDANTQADALKALLSARGRGKNMILRYIGPDPKKRGWEIWERECAHCGRTEKRACPEHEAHPWARQPDAWTHSGLCHCCEEKHYEGRG